MNEPRICSQLRCSRVALFFEEHRYEVRTPICDYHKSINAKPYEPIELLDAGELSPVVVRMKDILGRDCRHRQVLVDSDLRTLTCELCGVSIDPITFIVELANDYRSFDYKLAARAEFDRNEKEKREASRARDINRQARSIGIKLIKQPPSP